MQKEIKYNFNFNILIIIVIGLVILLFFSGSFKIIESGNVGIKITLGKYSPNELYPGLHIKIPFIQQIKVVDVKYHTINYKGTSATYKNVTNKFNQKKGVIEQPMIQVLDQRGLPIYVELTIRYRLYPDKASETLQEWGINWEDKAINPVVRAAVRDVIGRYPAEKIPTLRQEIAVGIESLIRKKIDEIEGKPIEVKDVLLRNILLPPSIAKKIEEVQQAKQEAQRMKYEEEKAKKEQEIRLIKAETEKQEKIKVAEGIKEANLLISSSITPMLIKWKQLDVQAKMAEAIKNNPNVTIFMGTGNMGFNLWTNLPKKK